MGLGGVGAEEPGRHRPHPRRPVHPADPATRLVNLTPETGGGVVVAPAARPQPHVVGPAVVVPPPLLQLLLLLLLVVVVVVVVGQPRVQRGAAGGHGREVQADVAVVHGQRGAVAEGAVVVPAAEAHGLLGGRGVAVQVELVVVVVRLHVVDDGLERLLAQRALGFDLQNKKGRWCCYHKQTTDIPPRRGGGGGGGGRKLPEFPVHCIRTKKLSNLI